MTRQPTKTDVRVNRRWETLRQAALGVPVRVPVGGSHKARLLFCLLGRPHGQAQAVLGSAGHVRKIKRRQAHPYLPAPLPGFYYPRRLNLCIEPGTYALGSCHGPAVALRFTRRNSHNVKPNAANPSNVMPSMQPQNNIIHPPDYKRASKRADGG